jgi:peptidase M28-like protein/PDZ domain-containing protein
MAALESIQPEELRQHVSYLADDEREGREAGSTGSREAADYLTGRLKQLGMIPAGVDDGFLQPFDPNYRNILALLKGRDPELSQQYVLIGAHYDHVGYGTRRNSRGTVGEIHNGADDNASGVSGVLELAEAFTILPEAPKRSILFVFWDAEEKGLFGSRHWIDHPTVPVDQVVCSLTLDMIGRLRDDRLTLYGTRTACGLRRLASQNNDTAGLSLDFDWKMIANGDHHTFFKRGIPTLFAYTGVHEDYHRSSDDVERINTAGMRQVVQLLFSVTHELANREEAVRFRAASRGESSHTERAVFGQRPALPLRLGATWEVEQSSQPGVQLSSVRTGSAAEKAGIKPQDRIVELAGREIHSGDDLVGAVSGAVNPTSVSIHRPGNDGPLELSVELDGEPLRLGISWRADDAEPNTVVVTHVVAGTSAALAGFKPGDRIYQIAERDFLGEDDFAKLARTLPGPLSLLVERNGRLRTLVIRFELTGVRQAA